MMDKEELLSAAGVKGGVCSQPCATPCSETRSSSQLSAWSDARVSRAISDDVPSTTVAERCCSGASASSAAGSGEGLTVTTVFSQERGTGATPTRPDITTNLAN